MSIGLKRNQEAQCDNHDPFKKIFGESSENAKDVIARWSKLYHLVLGGVSIVVFLICAYLCFRPVAKIGPMSMGNVFQTIGERLNGEFESSKYLSGEFIVVAICSICFSLIAMMNIFIYCSAINFANCNWKKIVINVFGCIGAMIIIRLLLKNTSYYYACKFTNIYIIVAALFVTEIAANLLGCLLCIKDEEFKNTVTVFDSYSANKLRKRREFFKKRGWVVIVCVVILAAVFFVLIYSNGKIEITKLLLKSECELNFWFDSEHLKVGNTPRADRIIVDEDKELIINTRDSSKEWIEYGNNYLYYKNKINELIEERNDLVPDKASSSNKKEAKRSMEKYIDEIEELQDAIEYLQESMKNLPYNYAKIDFYNISEDKSAGYSEYKKEIQSYTHNRDVNYCDKDGKKWGYSDNSIMSHLIGESIELSETKFNLGTDFSKVKIIAYVTYSDGSKKISVITPSNIDELNIAGHGTHKLKWSDEWG